MAKYSECRPDELLEKWDKGAAAVVPLGALEWHGAHLPLGLDGIVSEWFCDQLAKDLDGVLLPGIWLPITTLPHRLSLQVRTETFRLILEDLVNGLIQSGARKICLITGHYAQGHQIELAEFALRAMDDHPGIMVFTATPLELLRNDSLLDHAARYETSQLLAIRPNLVHLEVDGLTERPVDSAILGEPPELASVEEGIALLQAGLEAWQRWINVASSADLKGYYNGVFDRYSTYVERYYKGSWEEAILSWWKEKGSASS